MAAEPLPLFPGAEALLVFRMAMLVTFVLSALVFVCIVLAVFRSANSRMASYRWYILHGVVWSFVLDIVLVAWMPVEMLPLPCITGAGLLTDAPAYQQGVAGTMMLLTAHGKILALFIAITYRYAKPNAFVHSAVVIGGLAAIAIPIALTSESLDDSSYICLATSSSDGPAGFSALYGTLSSLVLVLVIIILIVAMLMHLRRLMRTHPGKRSFTFRLQLMLYESIQMQFACGAFMFFAALVINSYVLIVRPIYGPYIMMFYVWLTGTHSVWDGLAIIAYVRPYRLYLFSVFKRAVYAIQGKEAPSSSLFTSQIHPNSSKASLKSDEGHR